MVVAVAHLIIFVHRTGSAVTTVALTCYEAVGVVDEENGYTGENEIDNDFLHILGTC